MTFSVLVVSTQLLPGRKYCLNNEVSLDGNENLVIYIKNNKHVKMSTTTGEHDTISS